MSTDSPCKIRKDSQLLLGKSVVWNVKRNMRVLRKHDVTIAGTMREGHNTSGKRILRNGLRPVLRHGLRHGLCRGLGKM